MLSYLECLMSEYHIGYAEVWSSFPVVVGFALMEARRARLGDDSELSHIDRAGLTARKAERLRLEREYRIMQPPKQPASEP